MADQEKLIDRRIARVNAMVGTAIEKSKKLPSESSITDSSNDN